MQTRAEERGDGVRSRACGLFGLLCSVLVGCGSDVTVADQAKRNDAGNAGNMDGAESQRQPDASKSITLCGSARCEDLNVNISGAGEVSGFGCCADYGRSACGVVFIPGQCTEFNEPGHPEMSCPSAQTPIGVLPGCCRPDGACGVLVTSLRLGCAQVPFVSQFTKCMY